MDPKGFRIALPPVRQPAVQPTPQAPQAPTAAGLAASLSQRGVVAAAEAEGVAVSTVTTAGLTAVAAVLFAAFDCGLGLDLAAEPPVLAPNPELPRGGVEVAWPDGRREPRQGLQPAQVGYVLRTALATTGR